MITTPAAKIAKHWGMPDDSCWKCGWARRLQRCHIVPDSLDGEDEPGNLVLLCYPCHLAAPDVLDRNAMWEWIDDGDFEVADIIREGMRLVVLHSVTDNELSRLDNIIRWLGADAVTCQQGHVSLPSKLWVLRNAVRVLVDTRPS